MHGVEPQTRHLTEWVGANRLGMSLINLGRVPFGCYLIDKLPKERLVPAERALLLGVLVRATFARAAVRTGRAAGRSSPKQHACMLAPRSSGWATSR